MCEEESKSYAKYQNSELNYVAYLVDFNKNEILSYKIRSMHTFFPFDNITLTVHVNKFRVMVPYS
jgi:hypothetical protein